MSEKVKVRVAALKIGISIFTIATIGGITIFAITCNINNDSSTNKNNSGFINSGDINGDVNYNVYLDGKEYQYDGEDVRFHRKEKQSKNVKTVAVSGISIDEIIDRTPLCKPHVNCTEFVNEDDFDLGNVFPQAGNVTYWNTRAKTLRLLSKTNNQMIAKHRDITWEIILTKIIEKMSSDPIFMVRREALKTFDALTDFNRKDDFDFISALKWWENPDNEKTAIEKLEKTRN